MNFQLTTYQVRTSLHTAKAQTGLMFDVRSIESLSFIGHSEAQPVVDLTQIHFPPCRSTMLLQILKRFLNDTKQAKGNIRVNVRRNSFRGKIDFDALVGSKLPAQCAHARDESQFSKGR